MKVLPMVTRGFLYPNMNSRAVMGTSPSELVCPASRLIPILVKNDMSFTTSAMLCNRTQWLS
jgi:hypothetical protein